MNKMLAWSRCCTNATAEPDPWCEAGTSQSAAPAARPPRPSRLRLPQTSSTATSARRRTCLRSTPGTRIRRCPLSAGPGTRPTGELFAQRQQSPQIVAQRLPMMEAPLQAGAAGGRGHERAKCRTPVSPLDVMVQAWPHHAVRRFVKSGALCSGLPCLATLP